MEGESLFSLHQVLALELRGGIARPLAYVATSFASKVGVMVLQQLAHFVQSIWGATSRFSCCMIASPPLDGTLPLLSEDLNSQFSFLSGLKVFDSEEIGDAHGTLLSVVVRLELRHQYWAFIDLPAIDACVDGIDFTQWESLLKRREFDLALLNTLQYFRSRRSVIRVSTATIH